MHLRKTLAGRLLDGYGQGISPVRCHRKLDLSLAAALEIVLEKPQGEQRCAFVHDVCTRRVGVEGLTASMPAVPAALARVCHGWSRR